MRIRAEAGVVAATAWGDGADWMLERVPEMTGCRDDPASLATDHPLVRRLTRRHSGARFGATGRVFDALVRAVVGQKVSGKEAHRSLRGLERHFSDPAPGPRPLPLPPDPERMARAAYWDFHSLGLERRRAQTLQSISAEHERIKALAGLPAPDAQAALRRYRGVGVWSAAETMAVSHGDADAVSVGDYHHKNLVAWHLAGRPRGTDEEMLELLEPFRPHRGRVVRLLSYAGWAPKYGPRMPIRSIADR